MEFEDRCQQVQRPKYDCILFDLDDTLYPHSLGLADACTRNIEDYMATKLRIEKSKIHELCSVLYKHYGTTMAGLRAIGYKFSYDDYHCYVHGRLPYEMLKPDLVLRNLLLSLPFRKVIFTNADEIHASKVVKRLGLEDCFEGIIFFETLNPPTKMEIETRRREYLCKGMDEIFDILQYFAEPDSGKTMPKTPILLKPFEEDMTYALRLADIDPQRTIFLDDSVRNIQSGKRIGLHTVLVGSCRRIKGADHSLENIHNLKEALPHLWADAEKSEELLSGPGGKVAVETSVTA